MPALLKTTQIQEPSSATVNLTLGTDGTMTTGTNMTVTGTAVMSSPYTMRNKIINGAMVIDQRNAGAAVSLNNSLSYINDRWVGDSRGAASNGVISFQQSTTAPTGYSNSLSATLTTPRTSAASGDVFAIYQKIEGFNCADLAWGGSSAQTVTLSFQVRSSITGTYSGAIENSAQNRSYPFTYTISSANTWEQKSVTITGDTTGTWLTNNGIGMWVMFNLGCGSTYLGTAGAWAGATYLGATGSTNWATGAINSTFYITGVQLERGTVATPFEYRNYQQELAMAQRYFALAPIYGTGIACTTTTWDCTFAFPVPMRATPTMSANTTVTISNVTTADYTQSSANINTDVNTGSATSHLRFGNFTGLTAGNIYQVRNGNIYVNASAEL